MGLGKAMEKRVAMAQAWMRISAESEAVACIGIIVERVMSRFTGTGDVGEEKFRC